MQSWCVAHTCLVFCVFLCCAFRIFEVQTQKQCLFGIFWAFIRVSAVIPIIFFFSKKNPKSTLKIWKHIKICSFQKHFPLFLYRKNLKIYFPVDNLMKTLVFGRKMTENHCIFLCCFGDFGDFSLCLNLCSVLAIF